MYTNVFVCVCMTQTSIQNMETKIVYGSFCRMHLLQQISYVLNTKLLLLFFFLLLLCWLYYRCILMPVTFNN